MQFILKLLRKILESLKDYYTSEQFDELSGVKVGKDSFNGAISAEAEARASADEALESEISSAVSNQTAMENVARWQGYANAMQSMVDEETAAQIAEEFEKATVEYLKDPTATKEWASTPNITEGTVTSTNPFYKTPSTRPIVDFSLTVLKGQTHFGISGSFNNQQNVPVFAPRVTNIEAVFAYTKMTSPVFFYAAERAYYSFSGTTLFNQLLSLPKAWYCYGMLRNAKAFNQLLSLPSATNCSYMLADATSFNQPLSLPLARDCNSMLRGARSFNQPLDLPSATNCNELLYEAVSFNQHLHLPKADIVTSMLRGCHAFREVVDAPLATNWNYAFYRLIYYDRVVSMPSAKNAIDTFTDSGMSASSISGTLDTLPEKKDGNSHTIGLTGTPGMVATATPDTFTVTDGDTEYSFECCPSFDTDDENQSLRKSFVLAVMKKGWSISMNHPIFHGEDGRGVFANKTMKSMAIALPNLTNGGDAVSEENGMFYNCTELESISVSGLSKLYSARAMFHNCSKLKTLVGFPSSWDKLTSAGNSGNYLRWGMFSCTALETTPDWTFTKLVTARSMFCGCASLTRVGVLSFPVLTDQAFWSYGVGMFSDCASLSDISGLSGAFPSLEVWSGMFNNCPKLFDISPILDQFSVNATIAFGTFCTTSIKSWSTDCPKLTNASAMFRRCYSLKTVSGEFQSLTIGGSGSHGMFQECAILESITSTFPALSNGKLMFYNCAKLNIESAERVLNSLPEWTDGESHVITFSGCTAAINAGLNGENAAVVAAVARGWTVEL